MDMDARSERANALDVFADAATPASAREAYIPQQAFSVGGDRVVGAQQVAVYRNTSKVLGELKALAAAVGEAWYYRFPVKNRKENRTDWIEGPSIKLANDLARIYGNCDIDIRVVDARDSWTFYARFTDYETGFSLTRPFQQQKNASKMGGDDARRLDIAFQIGVSKAERNVIVNALQTFADFAFQEARGALVDKIGRDLKRYVEKTRNRLGDMGPEVLKRVEKLRGRKIEEWLAPDVARTIAEIQAINDGMATIVDTWPETIQPPPAPRAAPPPTHAHDAATGEIVDDASEDTPPESGNRQAPADDGGGGSAVELPQSDPDTTTAVPAQLSADDRRKLRLLADALGSVNTPAAVEKGASRFWNDHGLGDDDVSPLAVAATEIVRAQSARTRGEISVAEADAAVRKVLPL